MDPKLKAYLEKMEARINKRLDKIEEKMATQEDASDILTMVRNIGSHLSEQVREIDTANTHLRSHVDSVFKRIEFLESKFLKR
jgi:uncharacterized coiled-coil protein SlyX